MDRLFKTALVLCLCICTFASTAHAEVKLTTADRLAMLYAPQFNFTRDGEPLIHVGVMHGTSDAEFSSRDALRVLPLGDGGPEMMIPGGLRYNVRLNSGSQGVYKHWVVVQRHSYEHKDLVQITIESWVRRGYLPRTIEVGGLIAVGGKRFDTRSLLVVIGGFKDRSEARTLGTRLNNNFGIEPEYYNELLDYPRGRLSLRSSQQPAVNHDDVLWIAPTREGQTFRLKTPHGERTYAGSLIFTIHQDGSLSVVNLVPVETVLKGVVPSEVYTSAHMESLKAQAVAARGTLISALGVRHIADPYLLCSDVHCQAYSGLTREHARTNKAVDETRGEILFARESWEHKWKVVDARYSSNCGGYTEHNDNVWGDDPHSYLRGHGDTGLTLKPKFIGGINETNIHQWLDDAPQSWCNTRRYGGQKSFRWERSVASNTLQKYLDRIGNIGRIVDATILERGVSGRVLRMKITGTKGSKVLDRELTIRRAFGGLRSSMFAMNIDRDGQNRPLQFHFKGGGFGHGVGMCQTGAMMMAHGGRDYRKILSHYYQGSKLEKLY